MSEYKKKRDANWTAKEKRLLFEVVKGKIHIIENSKTDTQTKEKRTEAWKQVQEEFRIFGKARELNQLKEQWRRLKREARHRFKNADKISRRLIEGDLDEEEKPTELDYLLKELLPEFTADEIILDNQEQRADEDVSITIPKTEIKTEIIEENYDLFDSSIEKIALFEEADGLDDLVNGDTVHSNKADEGAPIKPKRKKVPKCGMSAYEIASLKLLQHKTELELKHAQEMHELRMRYEAAIFEARLEILNLEKQFIAK